MRVAFVYMGYENLGVEYLSAVLKSSGHDSALMHDPRLFDDDIVKNRFLSSLLDSKEELIEDILDYDPGLVAFSFTSDDYARICTLAKEIKKETGIPTVFGGIHSTSVPELVIENDFVDFVCAGEGEHALLELVRALEEGTDVRVIKNIWSKGGGGRVFRNAVRPLIQDLDSLPFPDKSLYEGIMRISGKYTCITGRGCPYSCTYCANSFLRKLYGNCNFVRRRSVENVISELKNALTVYKPRAIIFHDEVFTYDLNWLREFSMVYPREIGLPFFCWSHPDTINAEAVELLEKAGCIEVQMGVQTMNAEIRKNLLRRNMSNEQIRKAINLFSKTDIVCKTDVIFGIPYQTEADYLDMARFYNDNRVDYPIVYWLNYYPKTDIVDILEGSGVLAKSDVATIENHGKTRGFLMGGDTYDKGIGKYYYLLLLTAVLPRRFVTLIIDRKLYHYLPNKVFFLPTMAFMLLWQKLRYFFKPKRGLLILDVINHYRYFMYIKLKKVFRSL